MTTPDSCPQCAAPLQVMYGGPEQKDRWLLCEHCDWKQDLPDQEHLHPGTFHEHIEEIICPDGTHITRTVLTQTSGDQIYFENEIHDHLQHSLHTDVFIERIRQTAGDDAADEMLLQLSRMPGDDHAFREATLLRSSSELDEIPGLSDAERSDIAAMLHLKQADGAAVEREPFEISWVAVLIALLFGGAFLIMTLMFFS